MKNLENKKILISPLDWGLGHAARIIPLIKQLIKQKNEVIIASSGKQMELLKHEFPALRFLNAPKCNIIYHKNISFSISVILQIPKIIRAKRKEQKFVKELMSKEKIDVIISDNRLGFYNTNAYCIYITHQIRIKLSGFLGIFEPLLHKKHKNIIRNFDKCLVPDYEGKDNLTGLLSHDCKLPVETEYIGILSRFKKIENEKQEYIYDILVIISGPENQRTIFENILVEKFSDSKLKVLIVRGLPGESRQSHKSIEFKDHLNSKDLFEAIKSSEKVICRAGYSSIMDFAVMGKKVILVPTPGQSEQEYLAKYNSGKENFEFISQSEFKNTEFKF